MEQLYLLFKLILVHLIGDFWLQPNKWVEHRNTFRAGSRYLYYHALIHGLLTLVILLPGDTDKWYYSILILVSHFLIDLIKSYQQKNKLFWFITDQLLHIFIIVTIWTMEAGTFWIEKSQFLASNPDFWIVVAAIVLLTNPSGIFIFMATERWRKHIENDKHHTLKNAGKWIGIIERVLIFTFILASQFEAVGFLITAKSIFRYGDLRNAEEKNQTEYLIIGTLLSFGIAIIIGMIIKLKISGIV